MNERLSLTPVLSLAVAVAIAAAGCEGGENFAHPSGTLEATEIHVAPLVTARVLEVRADEGEQVTTGDTLLVLDAELGRRQRSQAAAQVNVIAAQTREAEQLLIQAQRKSKLAQTSLDRLDALRAQGSATQQQADEAGAERDVASSQLTAMRAKIEGLTAMSHEVDAALAVFDRRIADAVVLSPITGTVLLRTTEPGEVAAAGAPALRLADLTSLDLRIYLEETDLDLVRIGQSIPVLVDALGNEELQGVVRWISDEAEFTPKNAQTRSARAQLVYAVKLSIANPDGRLHIGMPAAAKIEEKE